MQWARQEVQLKKNQYGGEPGTGAGHLLFEVMDAVTSALEDNRSAVVLSGLDMSKAFNRLEHASCLAAFAAKGASTDIIRLLGAFLSERTMCV